MARSSFVISAVWFMSILAVVVCLYLVQRFSFAPHSPFDVSHSSQWLSHSEPLSDSTISIAFLGDSWIHNGEVGRFVQESLASNDHYSVTKSFGYCGATSKDLYQMISNPSPLYHFADHSWDYVVVIIGVNDASGQYGPDFYAQHTLWIAERIISIGAFPIIVELPTFAIIESTSLFPWVKRVRNQIFAWWQGCSINNISCYRDALRQKINESDLKDKIRIVDFDQVCSQYSENKELYRDFFHLNRSGNKKLATAIAAKIMDK
jgi:lysophospholipase L1-like esterase